MSKRKETPDVLAAILDGDEPALIETPRPVKLPRSFQTAPSPKPPTAPRPATPKHWDYQVVSFQHYHGWRPRFQNGVELTDWISGPLLHEYIQQYADEGWEVAAAASGERMYGLVDSYQVYFKRPRP